MTTSGLEADNPNPIYDRALLADMLAEAAELEHSLCCQYLFAAFSMKRSTSEGLSPGQVQKMQRWQSLLMEVARQEMEHLGYVINLQIAIGSSPHLRRPDFPLDPQYYETGVESKLEKFSQATMQRFVLFELPEEGTMTDQMLSRLKAVVDYDPTKHKTIGQLYDAIRDLIKKLAQDDRMGADLFVGPRGAQFKIGDTAQARQVHRSSESGNTAYNIHLDGVTDLESALSAIEQIVEEGEGAHGDRDDSHFGKFLEILEELDEECRADPKFEPARDVIDNPRSNVPGRGNAQKSGTLITDSATNEVSRSFDQAYSTLMMLLARFFGATDQPDEDSLALEFAAFFPFMTMVIRPLSEVLTTLPAFKDQPAGKRAGPSFRYERRIGILGERESAFDTIADNMATLLAGLKHSETLVTDEAAKKRLAFIIENVWRIHANFKTATGAKDLGK